MTQLADRIRLARNPRAARIDFLIRKAATATRGGDVRAKAWKSNSAGGGSGSGGSFDPGGGTGGEENIR